MRPWTLLIMQAAHNLAVRALADTNPFASGRGTQPKRRLPRDQRVRTTTISRPVMRLNARRMDRFAGELKPHRNASAT